MGEHFRVGLGGKVVLPVAEEIVLECLIIFNHAIVDEGEFAAGVEVGMRVLIGRLAVRGPTRVADPIGPGRRALEHQLAELCNPASALPYFHVVAIHNRDAGRVVAAILEPTQAIEQNRACFGTADVAYDATHRV